MLKLGENVKRQLVFSLLRLPEHTFIAAKALATLKSSLFVPAKALLLT